MLAIAVGSDYASLPENVRLQKSSLVNPIKFGASIRAKCQTTRVTSLPTLNGLRKRRCLRKSQFSDTTLQRNMITLPACP
jgi:hypothetical protein